jgi:hypothetical protein
MSNRLSTNRWMEARLKRDSMISTQKTKSDWNYLNYKQCKEKVRQLDTAEHRRICNVIENRRREAKVHEKMWIDACFRILMVRMAERPRNFTVSIRPITWPHLKGLFLRCLRSYRPRRRNDIPTAVADHILTFL